MDQEVSNQNIVPQPATEPQPVSQPMVTPPVQQSSKKIFYVIGVFIVLTTIAAGAYILNGGFDKKQEVAQVMPTQIPTTTPLPDATANWKTYTITSVGLEFKLPPSLSDLGHLKEEIVQGEKGSLVCVSFFPENYNDVKPKNASNKSGICEYHILSKSFSAGTSSVNFEQGRGGVFSDLQGFKKENGKYYAKFVDNKTFEISNDLITEVKNKNNVQILKVIGKSYESGETHGQSVLGTPGNGRFGALINTRSATYPGFTIDVASDKLTNETFDQVLSTFKFTSQINNVCPSAEYIDCMPIVGLDRAAQCEPEYTKWVHANCPGVTITY